MRTLVIQLTNMKSRLNIETITILNTLRMGFNKQLKKSQKEYPDTVIDFKKDNKRYIWKITGADDMIMDCMKDFDKFYHEADPEFIANLSDTFKAKNIWEKVESMIKNDLEAKFEVGKNILLMLGVSFIYWVEDEK